MSLIELDGTPNDLGWIMAVMLFPNSKELREQYFTVSATRSELITMGKESRLELDLRTIQLLIDAPSYNDIKLLTAESTKRAVVAGDILSAVYLMQSFGIERPSINKAIHVIQGYAKAKSTKYGDGTKLHTSERYIREYWREFQPVAHLWAAFRLNQSYPFTKSPIFSEEGILPFLEVAKGIFEFGSSYVPKAAKPKEPILDAQSSWQLPLEISPANLKSTRFPDGLEKYLKNYVAPRTQY